MEVNLINAIWYREVDQMSTKEIAAKFEMSQQKLYDFSKRWLAATLEISDLYTMRKDNV